MTSLIMIGLCLGVLVMVALLLSVFLKRLNQGGDPSGAALDAFTLQDDQLIVNTMTKPAYRLDDVASVAFSLARYRGRYSGNFRIIKKDGHKSRSFLFDGSVYTRRFQLVSSREDILKSIEKMTLELQERGIPSSTLQLD